MSKLGIVLTTIQPPTHQVFSLVNKVAAFDPVIVIAGDVIAGDAPGPVDYLVPEARFLPIEQQRRSRWRLTQILGERHYARKNLAYLEAISMGATCLYETDDDIEPNEKWGLRSLSVTAERVEAAGWANVYRLFTETIAWPRGLPLDVIHNPISRSAPSSCRVERSEAQDSLSIVPGLRFAASGSPDAGDRRMSTQGICVDYSKTANLRSAARHPGGRFRQGFCSI